MKSEDKERKMKAGLRPPWKKGESGNPLGRGVRNATLVEAKKITTISFVTAVNKYIHMSFEELNAIWQEGMKAKTKTLDMMIISVMMQAIKHGDVSRFNFLLDRLIGKVKEKVEITPGVPQESLVAWLERRRKENPIVIEEGE